MGQGARVSGEGVASLEVKLHQIVVAVYLFIWIAEVYSSILLLSAEGEAGARSSGAETYNWG